MEQLHKSEAVHILAVFGPVKTLTAEVCSQAGCFRQLSRDLFKSECVISEIFRL